MWVSRVGKEEVKERAGGGEADSEEEVEATLVVEAGLGSTLVYQTVLLLEDHPKEGIAHIAVQI
jgi:hypothetical protein